MNCDSRILTEFFVMVFSLQKGAKGGKRKTATPKRGSKKSKKDESDEEEEVNIIEQFKQCQIKF